MLGQGGHWSKLSSLLAIWQQATLQVNGHGLIGYLWKTHCSQLKSPLPAVVMAIRQASHNK